MKIQRSFIPGDEWLYIKFYLGKHSSNNFITKNLFLISKELINDQLCIKWFYVRYQDPDFHIRYRIKLKDATKLGMILQKIKDLLHFYLNKEIIWKVQLDTYEREVERYGDRQMLISEDLFQLNSELCCELLIVFKTDHDKILESAIYILLLLFKSLDMKGINSYQLIHDNTMAFKLEQNPSKIAEDLLSQKFKDLHPKIENIRNKIFLNHTLSDLIE